MIAFAANSVLCRLALAPGLIDAASFATVRVVSGAAALAVFVLVGRKYQTNSSADWRFAVMLFTYMVFFSFAYLSLSAGTGALILFGSVQITMISYALYSGERFSALAWIGLALAAMGLVYLMLPGVTAPNPFGALLMAIAGVAWGGYSLLGRGVENPLEATARSFIYCVPLVLFVSIYFSDDLKVDPAGFALAAISGIVASGCGYAIWYAALRGLSAGNAATVQLSVPIIAAFGGVILISEPITFRLIIASIATLGGIAIVLVRRSPGKSKP